MKHEEMVQTPLTIDLNCDLGEGMPHDETLMPFISSANIACGYHAGDASTILKTIIAAVKEDVAVGAHPSFYDRENFGRQEINLSIGEIYELITQQLLIFEEIAQIAGAPVRHIKPHGALYNMSARNSAIAKTIAESVRDHNPGLLLFGLSGSYSITEAKKAGLQTVSEVFADRAYLDDGSLVPRSDPRALINDTSQAALQVLQIVKEGKVTTVSGNKIPIVAETICLHGDGEQAVEFAKAIYQSLKENGIEKKTQH